jgi:hypothetical protein
MALSYNIIIFEAIYNQVMKTLVGRKNDLVIFQELFNSDNSEFAGVYGRRRVGKTFLEQLGFRTPRHPVNRLRICCIMDD